MAIVKKYNSRLVLFKRSVGDIYVATFAPIDKPFKYDCGQFLHLALDPYDPSNPWPESRCFSIASTPDDRELTMIFSVKGKFTGRMASELKEGNNYFLKLPYGDLFANMPSLDDCVFIAGGTGISPYLSLFNSATDFCKYKDPYLYLGVRERSFNIYDGYLEKASRIVPAFNFNVIDEQKNGRLDIESIFKKHGKTTYLISGPPLMIKNFKRYLVENDVPEHLVKTDEWE